MSSQLRLSLYAALATMTTAAALRSVIDGSSWIIPVMGGIALVAAASAAIRLSPLPSAFEPIGAAVAVLLWVTAFFAHSESHLGIIPGRLAFHHLRDLASNGFTEIQNKPTPVPGHHGLVMLVVIALAAVALVVDLMVVTLRRAALAGLPLLALFTVCAATGHHGVGIVPFILAAIGYLWLLYADNREKVARWGAAVGTGSRARPASAWSTDATSAPPPASLGRRVGATAISLGVVVPLFIPGLHTGIDKHSTGSGGDGPPSSNKVVSNPIVSVASDLTNSAVIKVLTYTSTSSDPGYLRMTALDQFNGEAFSEPTLTEGSNAVASETLPVTPPVGNIVKTSISFLPSENLELPYLPVASTVIGTSVGDPWRYDPGTGTVFSATATTTPGMSYTTQSVPDQPTAADLEAATSQDSSVSGDLGVPKSMSPRILKLTKRITANATNKYQAALAIQRYFTTDARFKYSTKIPAGTTLTKFLFDTRTGFCQQFATAMTTMARLSGIPARVAVGFTAGKPIGNSTYLVTTHDAHAWPELWFGGYGWLAFEPTPRADGQAVTPPYAENTSSGKGHKKQHPTPKSSSSSTTPGEHHPNPASGANKGGPKSTKAHHHRTKSGSLRGGFIALIVVVVLALAIAPAAARFVSRRRRWRVVSRDPTAAAAAAWSELRACAIDLHAPWDDDRTPRQIAVMLAPVAGPATDVRASLGRLALSEERSRYSPEPPAVAADLRRDVEVVRDAIASGCSSTVRLSATFTPRSTLTVLRARVARASNITDRLHLPTRGGRRHLRPHTDPA